MTKDWFIRVRRVARAGAVLQPRPGTVDGGRRTGPLQNSDSGMGIERVHAVETALRRRIKGQSHAIQMVVDTLKLAVIGTVARTQKPVATFLLAGASGTGKTELVKAIADALGRDLVRFDMPNFSDRNGASSLFGAALTAQVRDCPDSVVLLDEIEKADPALWDPCLRLFDEGVLQDQASGQAVDFGNTLIFLTSNLLQDVDPTTAGGDLRRALTEAGYFRPELVSRIDRVILFHPLGPTTLREILRTVMVRIIAKFQVQQGLRHLIIQLDDRLVDFVLSRCHPQFGVRDAQRQAEMLLGKAIAEAFLRAGRAWREAESLWLGIENEMIVVKGE